MSRVRTRQIPETIPDTDDDIRLMLYVSDGANGTQKLLRANLMGDALAFDRALTECPSYQALSGAQKNNFKNTLINIRNDIMTIEGFTPVVTP